MALFTGTSRPVVVAPGLALRAPGVVGTAEPLIGAQAALPPHASAFEAALAAAAARAGADVAGALAISAMAREPPVSGRARQADAFAADRPSDSGVTLTVSSARDPGGSAALHTDADGTHRWLLPDPPELAATSRAGSVFRLPPQGDGWTGGGAATSGSGGRPDAGLARVTGAAAIPGGRLLTAERRIVRVFTWSTDGFEDEGAAALARRIEAPLRPYGFVQAGPEGWRTDVDWHDLDGRHTLLLLHGTFSTAQAAFPGLVDDASPAFRALWDHYGGRVIAFNHPSLYHTPTANAQHLLKDVPAGVALDVDVLSHSRGGLIARELVQRLDLVNPYGRRLRVGRAVFVAAPQRGTVLADGAHWQAFLDRMTNLVARSPDAATAVVMEGILAAVKLLARGMLAHAPGLGCLNPAGAYLRRLNRGPGPATAYFGLAAAYTPSRPGVSDRFTDALFGEPNDGVVPTAGVYAIGRSGAGFPLPPENYRVLELGDRLYHSAYFNHAEVNRQVAAWLLGP